MVRPTQAQYVSSSCLRPNKKIIFDVEACLSRRFPKSGWFWFTSFGEHCIFFSSTTSQKHQFGEKLYLILCVHSFCGINFKFSLSSTHGFHFKFNSSLFISLTLSSFSFLEAPPASFSASHKGKEHDRLNSKLE
jgi:hypothetical protein